MPLALSRTGALLSLAAVLGSAGIPLSAQQSPSMPSSAPIVATAAGDTTVYRIVAKSGGADALAFVWSITKSCGTFSANGPQATWVHTGCPSDALSGAFVSAAISDGHWRCRMLYANGAAAGSGSPFSPERCVPVVPGAPASGVGGGSPPAPIGPAPNEAYAVKRNGFDPGLIQFGAGYQYLHAKAADFGTSLNLNGIAALVIVNPSDRWQFEFQLTGGFRSRSDISLDRYLYVFGLAYNVISTPRVRVFGHVLAGGAYDRVTIPGTFGGNTHTKENTFTVGAGGGLDLALARSVSLRLAEVDFQPTHFSSAWQQNVRFLSAVVIGFDH